MSHPQLPYQKFPEQEILNRVFDDVTNTLAVDATIEVGDIEIGAVELKNGTDDTRATILSNNALKTDQSSVAGTTVSVNVGTADAGVQRVSLARDARGNSIPSEYESPMDFAVSYTSGTTITCAGAPFTVDDANCTILFTQVKPSATGVWGARYMNGQDGVSLVASSNVIAITGAGTPFTTGDTYRVGLAGNKKSFVPASNSLVVTENNPNSLQVLEESLVDTTNVAAGTVYYPSSLGMAMMGYKDFSLTGKMIDTDATLPLTVEVTNDEDATNADWIQIYGYDFKNNSTVNNITASTTTVTFAWGFENLNVRYLRTKIVPVDSSNTVIIKARRKA